MFTLSEQKRILFKDMKRLSARLTSKHEPRYIQIAYRLLSLLIRALPHWQVQNKSKVFSLVAM